MRTTPSKLILLGHGGHGKDEVAALLKELYGISYASSSLVANETFIYESLRNVLGYETLEQCYEDRRNQRELWYHLIRAYNEKDRTRLATEIFNSNICYVGLRDREEFEKVKLKYGDELLVIWVDAYERLRTVETGSIDLTEKDADIIIDNNGTLEELRATLESLHSLFSGIVSKDQLIRGQDD